MINEQFILYIGRKKLIKQNQTKGKVYQTGWSLYDLLSAHKCHT